MRVTHTTLLSPPASNAVGLRWLPDETLFSLCSRYHLLTGHVRAATTCLALFGHRRRGLGHDFPTRLSYFDEKTAGVFGTPSRILNEHSIAPAFAAVGDERRRQAIEAAAFGEGIGDLKIRLGLLSGRLRAHHPLRYCRRCVQCDRDVFGVGYWHVQHQLPATLVCIQHGELLKTSSHKANAWERFSWTLPTPDPEPATVDVDCTPLAQTRAMALSMIALALWRHGQDNSLPCDRVAAVYARGAADRGLARGRLQRNRTALGESLADFVAPLLGLPDALTLPLPKSAPDASASALRMIYPPRGSIHPARHTLMMAWLFGSWTEFVKRYQAVATVLPSPARNECEPMPDSRRTAFLDAVLNRGVALSTAARTLGVDPGTGQHWLLHAGVEFENRRPSILLSHRRACAIAMVRAGDAKADVAAACDIAIVTVTRLMRTEPGLQAAWHQARFQQMQQRYRQQWANAISQNPSTNRKLLRALNEAAYAWLYRNDREWLVGCQSCAPSAPKHGGVRSNWDERDREFSEALDEIAALRRVDSAGRLTLREIAELVPGLVPKLRRLDALPLTALRLNNMLYRRRPRYAENQRQHLIFGGEEQCPPSTS